MTLSKLINYRNQHPQLGLPRDRAEFEHRKVTTYELLVNSGFIDQLKAKSDISVILRTGGTSSLAYKIFPSSRNRFRYNDREVRKQLSVETMLYLGLKFIVKIFVNKIAFLPGNMFESDDVPVRYVSNALTNEKIGFIENWVCPVPQGIFDGIDPLTGFKLFETNKDKLSAIALCYRGRNPAVISGVPGVVLQFAQEREKLYNQPFRPQVVIVGGCAIGPYVQQLRDQLGQHIVIIPYYNATEGTFGYQPRELWDSDDYETLALKHDCGVWYELMDLNGQIIAVSDSKLDIRYRLLISTYDGLCRYELGDVIEMVDVGQSWIKIVGRTSEYIDIANEHTQIQHVQQTMSQLGEYYDIGQYCVFPSQDEGVWHYVLVVESSGYGGTKRKEPALDSSLPSRTSYASYSEGQFAEKFDEILGIQNCNYAAKRSGGTLGPARVKTIEQGWFDDLIAQLNHERQSTQSKLLTLYPREDNPVYTKLML